MAGTWTRERYPAYREYLTQLMEQHRELKDEPLHLAIAFQPPRETQDIFLFEVVGNFAGGDINPGRELFEVTFAPSPGYDIPEGRNLHLVLTSPEELRVALQHHWSSAQEVSDAVRRGDAEVLHADDIGQELLERLRHE